MNSIDTPRVETPSATWAHRRRPPSPSSRRPVCVCVCVCVPLKEIAREGVAYYLSPLSKMRTLASRVDGRARAHDEARRVDRLGQATQQVDGGVVVVADGHVDRLRPAPNESIQAVFSFSRPRIKGLESFQSLTDLGNCRSSVFWKEPRGPRRGTV